MIIKTDAKRILLTGGAGFIGSAVARHLINDTPHTVCVLDKLTYAGNLESLRPIKDEPRFSFKQIDIAAQSLVAAALADFQPDIIMHLAAESHVDRSIDGPGEFIQTNIVGTYVLLEAARDYYQSLSAKRRGRFRLHHISTDEVYGELPLDQTLFTEDTPYAPNSPYAASKAAADHLARAWGRTYALPVVVTNCSNNYGPYHFPEKLIPLIILNALNKKALPVYGAGKQVRDWLYVEDHARALVLVATEAAAGATYNIGGHNERQNIEVVQMICALLDEMAPRDDGVKYETQISFVADRPGHDLRYAIDAGKIERELGWRPAETFASGLRKTVAWYIANQAGWCRRVAEGTYRQERLGLAAFS